jgi:hypothetical protein
MKDKIDFPAFTISLMEDGIVQADFKKIKEMTVEHVDQLYGAVAKLGEGKKICMLSTFQAYIPMNDEVMEYSMRKEFQDRISASASVLRSTALRVAVNFFLTFHKPKQPRKIFDSKEKALLWLRKIKHEVSEKEFALA